MLFTDLSRLGTGLPSGNVLWKAPEFAKGEKEKNIFGLQPTVAMDRLLNKLICVMVLKLIKYN